MKKSFTILLLNAMLYLLPGWNGTNAQTPLNFQGSFLYNPVLTKGNYGTWEDFTVFLPYLFLYDGTFYMYYSGVHQDGSNTITSIGLATSPDGYIYTKYPGNPVFTPGISGFDSFNVTSGVVIEGSGGFIMYYNAREFSGYGPGPSVGWASAPDPAGPWSRSATPVLTSGSNEEWDDGFVGPNAILTLDTGGFIMFYSGGHNISTGPICIGMATSPDGFEWTKYDDPNTTDHPYSESDPVLKPGESGDWDGLLVMECSVVKKEYGYDMYYTGCQSFSDGSFGFASSTDGISWEKYPENPVYTLNNDPYALSMGFNLIEQPTIVFMEPLVFMYYDYGIGPGSGGISVATADFPTGIRSDRIPNDGLRISNWPNPVLQQTTFSFNLKEPGHVKIQVFDNIGRLVAEPLNSCLPQGENNVVWNAGNLPGGFYFYRLLAGLETGTGKIVKY